MQVAKLRAKLDKRLHVHKYGHIGGGCIMFAHVDYPCDDQYECRCGKKRSFQTTQQAHFHMPDWIKDDWPLPAGVHES